MPRRKNFARMSVSFFYLSTSEQFLTKYFSQSGHTDWILNLHLLLEMNFSDENFDRAFGRPIGFQQFFLITVTKKFFQDA